MIDPNEVSTPDLFPSDLVSALPAPAPVLSGQAARTARYRAKHKVTPVTISLPDDVAVAFNAYLAGLKKKKSKSEVITKLIQTQLLRPR